MSTDLDTARRELVERGWCVLPDVLAPGELAQVRAALDAAIAATRARGQSTHTAILDPNEANVRVYNLPDFDPVFVQLLRHPAAQTLVESLLGPAAIVSNFTANVALPGSGSMNIHADQALVIPPPWTEPWAINIIWCLDDVHEGNGATRYVPGSQKWATFDDVPDDVDERSLPFEAPAGALIAMDGRVWHTSGANTSANERRAMMFAYYSKDFIRQQINWDASLSEATKASLDPEARRLLGMGPSANVRIGGGLTKLRDETKPDLAVSDVAA